MELSQIKQNFPLIQPHATLVQAVNARELHKFIGSKRQFANWIKERVESYEFLENIDYVVFNNFVKNPKGGRSSIEYAITVTMAKELAMVENNQKGKEVRKYFIDCERQTKQIATSPQINSIDDLLNASLAQGKTATEICNQVTRAENISFGEGSIHGKGLNKRKKEKRILIESQQVTLEWMQFKLPLLTN